MLSNLGPKKKIKYQNIYRFIIIFILITKNLQSLKYKIIIHNS